MGPLPLTLGDAMELFLGNQDKTKERVFTSSKSDPGC